MTVGNSPVSAQDERGTRTPVKEVAPQRLAVETPQGKGLFALYVSEPWDKPLPNVARAVVYVHGLHRTAQSSFRDLGKAAARVRESSALLIAPHFLSPEDIAAHNLPPEVLRWKAGIWMSGVDAEGPARINGFDAMDAILARLGDRARFPNLKQVVLAGHSAGGQFIQRYAVAGRGEAALVQAGIHVRYVVANPSSYVYLTAERPAAGGSFAAPDASACPHFNRWKFGLEKPPRYVSEAPLEGLEAQYLKRDVVYLLGTADNDPNHPELDKNCGAELEGPQRFARGHTYFAYLQKRHGAELHHRVWDVPGVAHNGGKMIGSTCGLAALFDKGGC